MTALYQNVLFSQKDYKSLNLEADEELTVYFSADKLQKELVQPLVEKQSNAEVLFLERSPQPIGELITLRQIHTMLPKRVSFIFKTVGLLQNV